MPSSDVPDCCAEPVDRISLALVTDSYAPAVLMTALALCPISSTPVTTTQCREDRPSEAAVRVIPP